LKEAYINLANVQASYQNFNHDSIFLPVVQVHLGFMVMSANLERF